jgi:hypothetical protein
MPIIAGGADRNKPKGVAAMIVESMTGEEKQAASPENDGPFLARQLMAAIEGKDENRVFAAFKALFQHCENQPHEEYEEEHE